MSDPRRALGDLLAERVQLRITFFDGDRRGYVLCTLDRDQWRSDLRMMPTVSPPDAPISTFASFVVEDGQPGAVQV